MIKERIPITDVIPPNNLISWLTYQEMLTTKLYNCSQNTSLKVLKHDFFKSNWWDRYVLGISSHSILHREVVVSAWNIPCWYARTIIPKETYYNHSKLFITLENKSLGEIIFSTKNGVKRSYLKYYAIDTSSIEYNWLDVDLTKSNSQLWARLSKFTINSDFFYLFEVFLPGLEKYLC